MKKINKIIKQRFLNNNIKVRYKRVKKEKVNYQVSLTFYLGFKYISFYNLDKIKYSFNSYINRYIYYFTELEYYNKSGFIHNTINKPAKIYYYNLKFSNDSGKICHFEYYKNGKKIYK